jgi:hypothetical protein
MIETDRPLSGRAVANRVFVIREVGDEAKLRTDQTLAEIRDVLGEERWRLVQARLEKVTCKTCFDLNRTLNQLPEELRIRLETDDRGIPTVFYEVCEPDGEVTTRENLALSMFLPDGDPNRTQDAVEVGFGIRSNALSQRVLAWLREQAVVRLGKKARQ